MPDDDHQARRRRVVSSFAGALDAETRSAIAEIGPVHAIVAPSKAHHLFAGDYVKAYPAAKLYGAPGLAEKRRDLNFAATLGDEADSAWEHQIAQHLFLGAPRLNEVVFFHPASRTVIFTDLVFNMPSYCAESASVQWLTGAAGHFGPHRLIRRMLSDRTAARTSVEKILEWDFDRVIALTARYSAPAATTIAHRLFLSVIQLLPLQPGPLG
jgi:hypothetical protein